MAQGFEHFLMTYFSVRHATARQWAEFPTPWLETRLALFEAFCLPSVAAQRASDFRWLIFCDVSTDVACLA
jgi:hypothetical protein